MRNVRAFKLKCPIRHRCSFRIQYNFLKRPGFGYVSLFLLYASMMVNAPHATLITAHNAACFVMEILTILGAAHPKSVQSAQLARFASLLLQLETSFPAKHFNVPDQAPVFRTDWSESYGTDGLRPELRMLCPII